MSESDDDLDVRDLVAMQSRIVDVNNRINDAAAAAQTVLDELRKVAVAVHSFDVRLTAAICRRGAEL